MGLAEAMFSSVSVITVFRRRAESGTNLTDYSLFLSKVFTGVSIQGYTSFISLMNKFDTGIHMCAQEKATLQAMNLML